MVNLGNDWDNNYNNRIVDAIGNCKIFVPILSRQIVDDFLNDKIGYCLNDFENGNVRYYCKEWWLAENPITPNMKKPIALYGYNCRSEMHKQIFAEHYPTIYNASVFNLYEKAFSEFLVGVEKILMNN